jgi:hypothetical protein
MQGLVRTVLLGFLLSVGVVFAQSPPPDCQFTASFTSATAGTAVVNKPTATGGVACLYWGVEYWTNGASGVSVKLEGASDSAGAPTGSYTALTAATGSSNPMTGTAQGAAVLCCDYYPWIRVNPTTFSGGTRSMIVRVYGWKAPTNPSAGGGATSNVNISQFGGVSVTLGQKAMAASMPVVLSSDQSAIPVTPAANSAVNVAQVAGTTAATNAGTANAGTQRVIVASDQSAIPVTPAANSAVNVAQVAGTTAATNAGTANAGTQRVIVASDQSAIPVTPAANSAVNLNQVAGAAPDPCFGQPKVVALINLAANTRIVTGTSAKKTYICALNLVAAAATNVAIVEGSGSTCGTSTLGLFGGPAAATGWNLAANGGIAYGAGTGSLGATTVNANDVCVLVSAGNQISGSIVYVTQ